MEKSKRWIKIEVKKGRYNKLTKTIAPYYQKNSNQYSQLAEFVATLDPLNSDDTESDNPITATKNAGSTFKVKASKRRLKELNKYMAAMNDNGIINFCGNKTEDG